MLSKPDQTKTWNLIKTIVMLEFQLVIHATDELHPVVMFELKLPEAWNHQAPPQINRGGEGLIKMGWQIGGWPNDESTNDPD